MSKYITTNTKQKRASIIKDIKKDRDILMIAFGGIRGGFGIPTFEFFNVAEKYNINKMFIRDLNQLWYHKGLKGLTENIDTTIDLLRNEIKNTNSKRVFTIGNSMGGYASLLFGALIDEINYSIAFSPQISMCPEFRENIEDFRWEYPSKALYVNGVLNKKYTSIDNIVNKSNKPIDIYYSTKNKRDMSHINLLNKKDNLFLIKDKGGHNLVKNFRNSGQLDSIIINAILKV